MHLIENYEAHHGISAVEEIHLGRASKAPEHGIISHTRRKMLSAWFPQHKSLGSIVCLTKFVRKLIF